MPHAHLICGGFPAGSHAGHDVDLVRERLLRLLRGGGAAATVASDWRGAAAYLRAATLLVTYTAGPLPDAAETAALRDWLRAGGRWVALHGSSGGKAAKPRAGEGHDRRIEKLPYHDLLGCHFLNHPPHRRFSVHAAQGDALTEGVPPEFSLVDEPYLVQLTDPAAARVFLTTRMTDKEARTPRFGFRYDAHPAVDGAGGSTLCLGYERREGAGGVVYIALGHAHSARLGQGRGAGAQPYVHRSANPDGKAFGPAGHVRPLAEFEGGWALAPFQRLVSNAVQWGLAAKTGGTAARL